MHTHECRECGDDIECVGKEGPLGNGCLTWSGSNDGCACAPHGPDCRLGYRCADCYPSQPGTGRGGRALKPLYLARLRAGRL